MSFDASGVSWPQARDCAERVIVPKLISINHRRVWMVGGRWRYGGRIAGNGSPGGGDVFLRPFMRPVKFKWGHCSIALARWCL